MQNLRSHRSASANFDAGFGGGSGGRGPSIVDVLQTPIDPAPHVESVLPSPVGHAGLVPAHMYGSDGLPRDTEDVLQGHDGAPSVDGEQSRLNTFVCDDCGASFNEKGTLQSHRRVHTGEKPFQCPHCPSKFSQRGSLRAHIKAHEGVKPHECPHCGAAFGRKDHLTNHIRVHTGEKPFKCSLCDKSFAQLSSLQSHTRTHTGEKPYACEDCGARFAESSVLRSHKRIHTGEKPYKCDMCPAAFTDTKSLQNHRRTHTGEKPFMCDICGASYSQRSSLTHHKWSHSTEQPRECPDCGKTFADPAVFARHVRRHGETGGSRAAKRALTCAVSPDALDSDGEAKSPGSVQEAGDVATRDVAGDSAESVVHATEGLLSVPGAFPQPSVQPGPMDASLTQLVLPVKTGSQHVCDVCGRSFVRVAQLENHRRVHTGEKPYSCQFCDAVFATSSAMFHHQRTKHRDGGGVGSPIAVQPQFTTIHGGGMADGAYTIVDGQGGPEYQDTLGVLGDDPTGPPEKKMRNEEMV